MNLDPNFVWNKSSMKKKVIPYSAIDIDAIWGSSNTKGLSELQTLWYSFLDDFTKNNITRLNIGEMITVHSAFKHPIKITFPSPSYKRI
ncbi:MAG TPA: hypothetical protein VF222_10225 [Nitrososphaeraceae archaeon]